MKLMNTYVAGADSPYRDPISMAILHLQEGGRLQILYNKWWKNAGTCSSDEKQGEKKVNTNIKRFSINPLKGRDVNWLHLAIQVEPTCSISDIRALWHSTLSTRVPECQKL